MKKLLLPLLFIGLSTSLPSVKAQEAPAVVRELATIDPQARDLLARLDARYKKLRTFQCLLDVRGDEGKETHFSARFRVQTEGRYRGAVTTVEPKKGVQKRVFDGQTLLTTDSRFPRSFTKEKLDAGRFNFRIFLNRAGAKGLVTSLLSDDNLASVFLAPDLQSIVMGAEETVTGKVLRSVIIKIEGETTKVSFTLLIDPENLILHRVSATDNTPAISNKTFFFVENYSEIKIDEPLPHTLFSTTPPPGFRLINSFETFELAIPSPIPNNVIKTKRAKP
jgi:outer membrane lipoprotein-sorting protein